MLVVQNKHHVCLTQRQYQQWLTSSLLVFQHQAFYEQDANCKNNDFEENIWRCIVDHLGQLDSCLLR